MKNGIYDFVFVQLHPLCCEELKKLKETWKLETSLHQCLVSTHTHTHTHTHTLSLSQDVLEAHFTSTIETTPTKLNFDLLQQMLSVYVRLSLHRAAMEEEERGCEVVREKVKEIRKWSERVLLPLLRGDV